MQTDRRGFLGALIGGADRDRAVILTRRIITALPPVSAATQRAAQAMVDEAIHRHWLKVDRAIMGDPWYPLRPDHPWRAEDACRPRLEW